MIVILAVALTIFIGVVDYLTGRDFALSAFYLLPICWACWMAGRGAGIMMSIIATIAWFLGDLLGAWESGFVYKHPLTPYWNGMMLLVLYLVVVFLMSAFQKAHYHLEDVVKERTAALQAEIEERLRLEKAKLQAERLATVGTMAAQVAHEIRNPLASMTLNLDLLQRDYRKVVSVAAGMSSDGLALLKDIREEVLRIKRVIEDYLQFARMPTLSRKPLALNDFLGEKLAFMNEEFEQAKVKLRTVFDPALKEVDADGEQLWQATLNLIRNGMDAMPGGGVLSVGTWREGDQARLRVTDSGHGMDADQLRQVFSPFFTTNATGTGLGLTMVQQIVGEHGGHVECESVSGKGTTFTIFLPVTAQSPNAN